MAEPAAPAVENVVELRGITTRFGEHVVHDGVDLDVRRGEILALVGGSGAGKSTLLREMILLQSPQSGSVRVLGKDLRDLAEAEAKDLRLRWGVMFQHGGLFGSLDVRENVGLPLREHTKKDDAEIDGIAAKKLEDTGLETSVGALYPAELSGGMLKRASLARALAMEPELLFLDEPTSGLDPTSAGGVDELVVKLRERFGLSVVIITHDLDMMWQVADRVAVLGDGKVVAVAPMAELADHPHEAVRQYFDTPRARAAARQAARNEGTDGKQG